ncbi:MAG TPA: hypothetical protein VH092_31775 [Urbifossiella sp.]|jgi:integrase|nr:hypothetical protein [Urbifossiella sp.]
MNICLRYEEIIRLHLKPRLGGVKLTRLDVTDVNRCYSKLTELGVKAATVKTCSEVLASCLEHAVRGKRSTAPPTAAAVKPKARRGSVEVFTDDEVKAILAAADGRKLEALFVIAVASGAREGELLALELQDVTDGGRAVHIRRMLDCAPKKEFATHPPKSEQGVRVIGPAGVRRFIA